MVLGFDSFSNRNECQEHFLGGKVGRCVRLTTLPTSCVVVMKSGSLNFLEHSGPLQACDGTALSLPLMQFYNLHFTFTLACLQERMSNGQEIVCGPVSCSWAICLMTSNLKNDWCFTMSLLHLHSLDTEQVGGCSGKRTYLRSLT